MSCPSINSFVSNKIKQNMLFLDNLKNSIVVEKLNLVINNK